VTEIRIPKLGHAMQEGTVSEWHVAEGAWIAPGDQLYLLETDKVENEIESPAAGVVHLLVPAGKTLPVGTVIARIEEA
jgi:pyruvate/2-oxoglutarate dehydrogenase complex dihydrolipoamide acyltransferase (E2) component